MKYRAGFLGLIGQPNAGKSTLLNYLVDEKVSIVSAKPQTTRRRVLGLWSSEEGQIVFVDAPGLIKADKGLNGFLAKEAQEVINQSDALLAIVSVDEAKAENAQAVIDIVAGSKKPWIGVITKSDLKDKEHRILILKEMIEKKGGKAFQIANTKEFAEDRLSLLMECLDLLPENPQPLYDIELFTPDSIKSLTAEIIREKCFEVTHEEVPYSLAVRILKFDEATGTLPKIYAEIIVAKENHKSILIGKQGQTIKQIGMLARKEVEKIMGEKVYLELTVSYRENWYKNENIMKELGYYHES